MESQSNEAFPLEHNEFHSSLEFDDTVGWHVYVVPALMLLVVVGGLGSILLLQ